MTIKDKLSRVKEHFVENKRVYLTGGACFIMGAAAVYFRTDDPMVSNKQSQFIAVNSPQTMEVFIEALGDPGNIVQDIDTGTVYASQGQAARALGVSPSRVSDHLLGRLDHVDGHRLIKLGKATVNNND